MAPGPVVVYGTGYDYPDWIGDVWYPGLATWGWGPFDLGWGVGFFPDFEFGFAFRHHFRHHGIAHVNVYHHWGNHARFTGGPVGRHLATGRVGRSGVDAYAGRDGHVYRRDGGQWLQHNHAGGWDGVRGSTAEHEQWHQARQLGEQRLGGGAGGRFHGGGGFDGGGGFHGGGGFAGGHGGGGHGR